MYSIFKFNILSFIKRKIIPKSLLSRFFLIIIVPTLIGQFFALHLFYERHWYNVSYHTSSLIVTEIESLLSTLSSSAPEGGAGINKDMDSPAKTENEINGLDNEIHPKEYLNLSYLLLKNQKIIITEKIDIEELEIFKKSLSRKVKFPSNVSIDENGKITVLLQIGSDALSIELPSKILVNPTTYIFALWVIFLTILLLSVSLIFSKNQIKSILDLTNAAEKYGRGEKMDDYKPSGAREIRRAGLAFIKMKDRIERQTTRRTQMLAMISHDLKTPLTRMKLQVELMNKSEEKEELNHDIDSMQYMISSYLDFARGEGGENFTKTELNDWIQTYIKSFWSTLNIDLETGTKKIYTQIKKNSFARALDNIISNASKYSTKIKISVFLRKDDAVITIEDNGKGIAEEERNLVFKPFYRGDKARTLESSTSVGLGLAITKEIIIGHYGTIELGKSKGLKGLLVRIKLPLVS
jgi:two-component system osmolarity sensor histidine kinase EnvZ